MLTYERQLELVKQKLATVKVNGNLSTFKYAKRAMYDYLWKQEPDLLECRGHTYDNTTGELVQAAPRKSFGYLEDGWWKDVPLWTPVHAYKKINGYMACATLYKGELVVSTTGTTNSMYAEWARELIIESCDVQAGWIAESCTDLYEVVVPHDPHIVKESIGLHHLGWREKDTGNFNPSGLRYLPTVNTLEKALALVETDRGEGFMVYQSSDVSRLYPCKLKTPYYVGKKKLMRMTDQRVQSMYENPEQTKVILPDMWGDMVDAIIEDHRVEHWIIMPEQARRFYIEQVMGD